ncbi:MAG: hypothetical protein EXS13_02065 [Planctomycetes bacterium]|nr:hypothetical protein [Planctomycetota bacterium]
MIRNGLHAAALLATVAVASNAVRLQVAAHLTTYDLARAHEAIGELEEERDSVRVRVLALYTPERVDQVAERWRGRRREALAIVATAGAPAEL